MTYDTLLPAGFCFLSYELLHFHRFHQPDFVFFGRQKSDGKLTSSIAIFGLSFGSCELQLCLAVWADYEFLYKLVE